MKTFNENSVLTFFGGSCCYIDISIYSLDRVLMVFHHSNGGKKMFLQGIPPMADDGFWIGSLLELFELLYKNLMQLFKEASEAADVLLLGDITRLIKLTNTLCRSGSKALNMNARHSVHHVTAETDMELYMKELRDFLDYFLSSGEPDNYDVWELTENKTMIELSHSQFGMNYSVDSLIELYAVLLRKIALLKLSVATSLGR